MILKAIYKYILVICFLLSSFEAASLEFSRKGGSGSAVKTLKTVYGDTYDCIDFYKQPAFNYPLLKNHTYHPQTKPTARPKQIQNNNISLMMNERPTDVFRLKDGGCPPGTVPIRRVNEKDDLLQTNVLPHQSVEGVNPNRGTGYISGTVYALGQTKSNPSKSYYGVGGVFSVYNPRALPSQYSSAEIILRGSSDSIIAGWTKLQEQFFPFACFPGLSIQVQRQPDKAGDLRCFSSECGYVIVRSDIPIDFAFHPISKKGEKVYINKFFVYQEKPSGDWWLEVGDTHPFALGFWPQRIFQGLKAPATYDACGGEISSIATLPPPEMGAGSYPDFTPALLVDSYCKDFVVVDETYTVVDVADSETYENNANYGVYDTHMRNKQHVITFGGP